MVMALAPEGQFWIILTALLFFGIGIPIIKSLYLTILQEVIPLEMQGRVNSIDHALSISIMPIATLVSGPIAEAIGINYLFVILASLYLIILTIAVLFTDFRYMDKGIINEKQ